MRGDNDINFRPATQGGSCVARAARLPAVARRPLQLIIAPRVAEI